jgi:hypothetical protein
MPFFAQYVRVRNEASAHVSTKETRTGVKAESEARSLLISGDTAKRTTLDLPFKGSAKGLWARPGASTISTLLPTEKQVGALSAGLAGADEAAA